MGLNNLSDSDLLKAITSEGGLQAFLKEPENARKFLGIDHVQRRRMADILKYESAFDRSAITKIVNNAALVTEVITSVITEAMPARTIARDMRVIG